MTRQIYALAAFTPHTRCNEMKPCARRHIVTTARSKRLMYCKRKLFASKSTSACCRYFSFFVSPERSGRASKRGTRTAIRTYASNASRGSAYSAVPSSLLASAQGRWGWMGGAQPLEELPPSRSDKWPEETLADRLPLRRKWPAFSAVPRQARRKLRCRWGRPTSECSEYSKGSGSAEGSRNHDASRWYHRFPSRNKFSPRASLSIHHRGEKKEKKNKEGWERLWKDRAKC